MYDAINMDPGATVAVSRKSARVEPPPVQPQSQPAPVYASNAAPSYAPPTSGKKTNLTPILIGVGVFFFICLCVSFFWWIDATFRWCVFFPFLSGC